MPLNSKDCLLCERCELRGIDFFCLKAGKRVLRGMPCGEWRKRENPAKIVGKEAFEDDGKFDDFGLPPKVFLEKERSHLYYETHKEALLARQKERRRKRNQEACAKRQGR